MKGLLLREKPEVYEVQGLVAAAEAPIPQSDNDSKRIVMNGMVSHRVSILKRISQQAHHMFIVLQNAKYSCNEALTWLTPIFNQWGPYIQFFDRLVSLMARKPDLPNKIITVKDGLEIVKELIGFFTSKLSVIQKKLKVLTTRFNSLILPVTNSGGKLKDWQEWSESFDNIFNLPKVIPIF